MTTRQLSTNGSSADGISRRTVLCGALLLAAGLSAKSVQVAVASEYPAAKGVKNLAGGKMQVTIASNPALKKVGGMVLLGDQNGAPTVLVRTAAKTYKTLMLVCTHQGQPLFLENSEFVCHTHGSVFALDGKVKISPALTPLPSIKTVATSKIVTIG